MTQLVVDEKGLLALLQDLVRINSVNPSLVSGGAGELEMAHFIGDYLQEMGLGVKYQSIDGNRANAIGILRGKGKGRSIMLNGHIDTVGVKGMKTEPFDPRYEDGKVFGRGSLDMKGGLAAMIGAARSIIGSGIELKGDLILAFVADEEYASLGTEALIKEFSADAAIICEPTDLQIVVAHKGFAWIRIEVFGKVAHGSQASKGIDAIAKAGKILVEMENLGRNILSRKHHSLLGAPSIHASLIEGGAELSTYPDHCKIELERRTLPDENRETVEREMEALISKLSSEDQQLRAIPNVFFYRPALEISKDQPLVQSLEKGCRRILGRKTEFIGIGGWMDSAILAEAGVPTIAFGPKGEGPHAEVEYVDFDSVIATTRILTDTIIDFCGQ